jgi:hypothetical protein
MTARKVETIHPADPPLANQRGEQLATIGIWAVIVYTAVRNVLSSASRPFWYDELCTVIVAGQPTLGKMWYALRHAEDSSPFLYVFVEHICASIVPNTAIAYRVPSIIGFAGILWCLFVFIRTRSGPGIGFVCALLPTITELYSRYAIEARSYELVVACVAIALVCYQRSEQTRWVVALAGSLLAAGAFLSAEFLYAVRTRIIRWRVWCAILSGFVPLMAAYPLLRQMKYFYGAQFWGQATWSVVWNMYGRLPYRAALIAMAILAMMSVFTIFVPVWRRLSATPEFLFADEHVLVIVLLALPIIEYFGIKLVHGSLTMRYALALILGVAIAVSYTLRFVGRWVVLPACIAVLLLVARHEVFLWKAMPFHPAAVMPASSSFEKLAIAAGHTDLPIVVSDGHAYVPLVYYASPAWRVRLVSLVDPASAVAYAGSDSVDRQLTALSCCFELQVYDLHVFEPDHPSFLLYSNGGDFDWWPRRLVADRYELKLLVVDNNQKLYLANRTASSQ